MEKQAASYTTPDQGERRAAEYKHPPEDGPELHTPPELREVLEAHTIRLLEAAEQRLAVSLQAWRSPHACDAHTPRAAHPAAVAEETRTGRAAPYT